MNAASGQTPVHTGHAAVLDLARWSGPLDAADRSVLERCTGPVLDIGCGPGRMVVALGRSGVPALGIDIVPEAVLRVRMEGGMALQRSVFEPLPGTGRWRTALLLDGCVGIGGHPQALLERVACLLGPRGVAYVEHDPDPRRLEVIRVLVRTIGLTGRTSRAARPSGETAPATADPREPLLAWAVVGRAALLRAAHAAGLELTESWSSAGRSFAGLRIRHFDSGSAR